MSVPTRTAIATAAAVLLLVLVAPTAIALPGGVPVSLADSGAAIAFGRNGDGQANVPALPDGVTYTTGASDELHTVLLRSDGQAVAFGSDPNVVVDAQLDIPALPVGMTYTAVAVGYQHTLLLRSDGQVLAVGYNDYGQTDVPPLPPGMTYTGVDAGWMNSAVLRSDGEVLVFGDLSPATEMVVPPLPVGLTYTDVEVTYQHIVLLLSNGTVVAVGDNGAGELDVPPLPPGLTYIDIAANSATTLLVRSDGQAFGFGRDTAGQATVPALPSGLTYLDGEEGENHSLLLRSDGVVVAFGGNASGHTTVPAAPPGTRYTGLVAGTELTILIRSAITTTTTVTAPSPVAAGATVTFSATVTPAVDPGVDFTGTVRFTYEDSTTEDIPIAIDGTAEVDRTAPMTPGSLTATAQYLGGSNGTYAASAPSGVAMSTVPPATIQLTVVGGATSVAQGGSLTFEVTGEDALGDPVAIDPSDIILTSSVPTDQIAGLAVTFPHASPHTITATFRASTTTSALTINVIPAAVRLANSGRDLSGGFGIATSLLGLGGVLVLVASRHRRRPRHARG
jgi:hypothetical protein